MFGLSSFHFCLVILFTLSTTCCLSSMLSTFFQGAETGVGTIASDVCNEALRYHPSRDNAVGGGAGSRGGGGGDGGKIKNAGLNSGMKGQPHEQSDTYEFRLNTTKYISGERVKVTVVSSRPYRRVLLQARRVGTTTLVGSFYTPPTSTRPVDEQGEDEEEEKTKKMLLYNCDNIADTLMTSYTNDVNNRSFIWTPPDNDIGLIHFVGTVYGDQFKSSPNITSKQFRRGFAKIDLSTCGLTKGCFRYGTKGCSATACEYLVTYHVTGSEAQFEMSGKGNWLAIGFSSDDKMGGDDVFMCVNHRGTPEVQRYVTELSYKTPTLTDSASSPLYAAEADIISTGSVERVSCRFSRPLKVRAESEDMFSVDLSNSWYQLYAWGSVSSSQHNHPHNTEMQLIRVTNYSHNGQHSATIHNRGSLSRHWLERPPTSGKKITLRHARNEQMENGAADVRTMHCVTFVLISSLFSLLVHRATN